MSDVKDIKGITDSVSQYVFSDMEYPCICLKDNLVLPKHKWAVISKLAQSGTDKKIALYISRNGELFKIGHLSGVQVKPFIDVIGLENMIGYHSENKELLGDRIYVLSC